MNKLSRKTLFLTDMDGTLTKGSVVLDHAGYLIEKGFIQDDGSYQAWKLDVKNEKLIVAVAENYRYQLIGRKVEELDVEGFIANEIANESKWYSTLQVLKEAKAQGHEVVIVSGSADFLVQELVSQLGFQGVGSTYLVDENDCITGEVVGMFGMNAKDEWIQNNIALSTYERVVGLGDTASDYGIFKHCEYNILVEPTSETMEFMLKVGATINEIKHS